MRLDKFLSNSGVGSRKEIKALVKAGSVTVDGAIATGSGMSVFENSLVCVNGKEISYKKYIYIMMNKPSGYVSATFDKRLPVVTDLLDEYSLRFEPFPAGRLDIDTEGMLILTNDGDLCHRILSPKSHIHKKYFVVSEKEVTPSDIEVFKSGIDLNDFVSMPADLELTDVKNESFVTLCEGKFHQVKRMFEAVDNKVVYLKRVKMGNLSLDESLSLGEYRELTIDEIKLLCEEDDI